MKAIISTTHDPMYQFFLPITAWCWNRLGVGVIVLFPRVELPVRNRAVERFGLALSYFENARWESFDADDNKEATYAQCSRLFGHTVTTPDDGFLITSDIDMLMFDLPPAHYDSFTVFGADLTPPKQYPICYVSAQQETWANTFGKYGDTLQECLDNLLGDIECDNMRGNYWGKDQETLFNEVSTKNPLLFPRAKEGTQFASRRIDRDDAFWQERLNPDIIDAHLWRPGYTEENVEKIIKLLEYMYPLDDHIWIREYAKEYREML